MVHRRRCPGRPRARADADAHQQGTDGDAEPAPDATVPVVIPHSAVRQERYEKGVNVGG
jgi:hypothetical protein